MKNMKRIKNEIIFVLFLFILLNILLYTEYLMMKDNLINLGYTYSEVKEEINFFNYKGIDKKLKISLTKELEKQQELALQNNNELYIDDDLPLKKQVDEALMQNGN